MKTISGGPFFVGIQFIDVRYAVRSSYGFPFRRQVDMSRAFWKCHVFWNNDFRAATQILINTELGIDFAVSRHPAPRIE